MVISGNINGGLIVSNRIVGKQKRLPRRSRRRSVVIVIDRGRIVCRSTYDFRWWLNRWTAMDVSIVIFLRSFLYIRFLERRRRRL